MRYSGVVAERDRLAGADHLCWVYDDPLSFTDAARRYLSAGLGRGDRLMCVGTGLAADLRAAGEPFGRLDDLVDRGTLVFLDLDAAYVGDTAGLDPHVQRAFYDAAVRRARENGYQGVRVVAEVTALAGTPTGRSQLVRWEHLADEYIASGAGLAAMCGYRRRALDDDAVAELTAVHPQVHAPRDVPSFQIWFDEQQVVLAGTVDTFGAARLARVLAGSPVSGRAVTMDLGRLEVADVAGCRAIARWGRQLARRGTRLHLAGAPRVVQRTWQLLGLGELAPVTFSEASR